MWSEGAPRGEKVEISSIKLNGTSIEPNSPYRVTVNSYLADGGDNFSVLRAGTDRTGGPIDTDAFVSYLAAFSQVASGTGDRIALVK